MCRISLCGDLTPKVLELQIESPFWKLVADYSNFGDMFLVFKNVSTFFGIFWFEAFFYCEKACEDTKLEYKNSNFN